MDTGEWSIGDEFFADQEEVINYLTREEQLKLLCCPIFHNL